MILLLSIRDTKYLPAGSPKFGIFKMLLCAVVTVLKIFFPEIVKSSIVNLPDLAMLGKSIEKALFEF